MKHRPLIIITDYLAETGSETKVIEDLAELRLLQTSDEMVVAREGHEADVLLVFHDVKLSERSIAALTKCKAIIRCGVGVDNVDVKAAGSRGIVVCNVPDYGTEEVADHALMLLLAIVRRLIPSDRSVHAGAWDPTVVFGAPRLRGRTLGLIGCGRIGSAMALRARALGMRVVFYDPYKPDGLDKALGIERCYRLEDLLPQSEFLSLHCPLTRETHHILNAERLRLLPAGAYVVNTGRGACIDLAALVDALDDGRVAHAGLDVVEREPLDDPRVRQHPNIVLTPHTAFYSVDGFLEMRTKGAQEARRIVLDEPVRNPVNLHCLTNPRCKVPGDAPVT